MFLKGLYKMMNCTSAKTANSNVSDSSKDAHIPCTASSEEDTSPASLIKELKEYIYAIEEKVVIAKNKDKEDIANILSAVATDMNKIVRFYEEGELTFNKCYEEVVSLYVFVEIYIHLED